MKLEMAKAIVRAGTENGYEMAVRDDYSGRFMFGRTTAGIVYDSECGLLVAVAVAAVAVNAAMVIDEDNCSDEEFQQWRDNSLSFEEFAIGLRDLSRDSMGLRKIVY